MTTYEPIMGVMAQVQIGLARLVEVLGEPIKGSDRLFIARSGDDRISAWPTKDTGWHVSANTHEAMDRFRRELIHPTRQYESTPTSSRRSR